MGIFAGEGKPDNTIQVRARVRAGNELVAVNQLRVGMVALTGVAVGGCH